jgi:tRNA (cmo5U34)-methyltransferase
MHNEHYLNPKKLTTKYIKSYIENKDEVNEFTCLVPKDDQTADMILRENGFRYVGKRLVEGEVMIVFKWFRDLDKRYEDMRSFFNRRVHDYDLHMKDGDDYYEYIFISLVKDIPRTDDRITILDLGCGTGAELEYIFQRAPNAYVVCMDVSEEMLQKLREDYGENSNNIKIICASYLGYDFGVKRYDYVIACNTLHHLLTEDKLALYVNVKKGLKDNGCLFMAEYIATSLQQEQSLRTNYLELINTGAIDNNEIYHIDMPLTIEHEVDLLKAAGFIVVRTERVGDDRFPRVIIFASL